MKSQFILRPSWMAAILLILVALPCAVGAWFIIPAFSQFLLVDIGNSIVWSALLAGAVLFSFAVALRRYAMLSGALAVRRINFLKNSDEIEVATNADVFYGTLATVSISPFVSVFVVKRDKRRASVLVFADSLDADDFRHLRIILKIRRREMLAKLLDTEKEPSLSYRPKA